MSLFLFFLFFVFKQREEILFAKFTGPIMRE